MIRMMADTWQEAVLRPLAMAAPNGWVYTEIIAPDFRFVFALGLALAAITAAVTQKRGLAGSRPVFVLLGLTFLSFVPWMATTGNGRYFMPYLILIGPLCIGLISILSCTRAMKASIAILVLSVQGFALYQNNPWKPFGSWELAPWKDGPYFSVDIDPLAIDPNATYVSISQMSLSLVAPQFPASSRWVKPVALQWFRCFQGFNRLCAGPRDSQVVAIVETFPAKRPQQMIPDSDQPNQRAIAKINVYLRPHRLTVKEPQDCKFLASKSLFLTTFMGTDEAHWKRSASRARQDSGYAPSNIPSPQRQQRKYGGELIPRRCSNEWKRYAHGSSPRGKNLSLTSCRTCSLLFKQ